MPNSTAIRRLKHNFDQVVRKQNEDSHNGIQPIIDQFNDILGELKEEHPDNRIQEIEDVEGTGALSGGHPQDLDEMRIKILDIVEFLELDREDFQEASGDQLPLINISQSQNQSQETNIDLSFDDIRRSVQEGDYSEDEQEELSELIEEYKQEAEKDNPDESKLKSIYEKVGSISQDVAGQLLAYAIKLGIGSLITLL